MTESSPESRTAARMQRIVDSMPLPQMMKKDQPRKTLRGWVVTERPGDATGVLKLFGILGVFGFVSSSLLFGLLWLTGFRNSLGILGFGAVLSAGIAALAIFLSVRTARVNADWHPGEFTFEIWPVPVGRTTTVSYELRRRQPLAEHPRLKAMLLYKELERRKDRASRFRTKQRVELSLIDERRTEPITIMFAITIPTEWSSAVESPDHQILLQVFRYEDDSGVTFPVELEIAEL